MNIGYLSDYQLITLQVIRTFDISISHPIQTTSRYDFRTFDIRLMPYMYLYWNVVNGRIFFAFRLRLINRQELRGGRYRTCIGQSQWNVKYRSRAPGQGECLKSMSRTITMQGLHSQLRSNFEVKICKVNGSQNIG